MKQDIVIGSKVQGIDELSDIIFEGGSWYGGAVMSDFDGI